MSTIDDILLTDLLHEKDLQIQTGTGDLATKKGLENIKDAVLRRIITKPGKLVHRPDYGAGLLDFQGAPVTLATKQEIARRIENNLKRDPRVKNLKSVSFDNEDAAPELLIITIKFDVIGYGETVLEFAPFQEVY